jgi:hypothetical protein
MVRAIVYDSPEVQAAYSAETRSRGTRRLDLKGRREVRNLVRAKAKAAAPAPAEQAAPQPSADNLQTKLVKYVPAEVVSVSAAGFAAFNPTGNWIWFGLGLGAVVNVIYLFVGAVQNSDKAPEPRWYFYLLSAAAFVIWAIATIEPIQKAMSLTESKASFILAAGAFGIPLLDSLFGVLEITFRHDRSTRRRAPAAH